MFRTSIRYLDAATGREVQIENPYIHHHDETLVGPGDPWLYARGAWRAGGFTLGGRLGVALPLGRTEEDPFALGDQGLAHEHSQFGTGTVQPLAGLEIARTLAGVRVEAFALTLQALYENGHGYQAGDRYAGGLGAASALGTARWRFRATAQVQHETAERWNGVIHTDEGNTGRTDVLAGIEATWRVTDRWHLGAKLELPVYTHVQGGQLDASLFAGLSVGTELHLFEGDEHDHAHEHGDHDHAHDDHAAHPPVDWTGLDMRSLTDDGAAVPLVPVPGKITVIDFWATWCGPCAIVDRELSALLRAHPDDLAVRKVNIVDADSPASQTYLGPRTIPHLKVYGRDGTLLWEKSAPPLALVADVAKLVTASPPTSAPPAAVAGARRIAITVDDTGYVPARIAIHRDEPVTLVFTRTSTTTCAVDVHGALPGGGRVDADLPLRTEVAVPLRIATPGEVVLACGMDMNRLTIVVE